jgi:CPA2 family monovalent cation:H+ antiporter-2
MLVSISGFAVIGIGLGGWFFVAPLLEPHPLTLTTLALFFAAVFVSLPFLAGVFYGKPPRPDVYDAETLNRLHQLQFGVTVVRFFIGCVLVVFIAGSYLGLTSIAGTIASVCIVCFLFLFSETVHSFYLRIERRFIVHLSDKERSAIEDRSALPHLVPWEATLTEFTVSEYSPLVMQTVQHSKLKQDFGVMIAIIRRGEKTIVAPHADERLLPSDRLYLIGTYDQLAAVQPVIEYQPEQESEFDDNQFGMLPFRLDAEHSFVGKTIRDCGVRDMVQGIIVGIEREGVRHLNPRPDMKMHAGDMLWLVGNRELIRILQRSTHQTESIIARWH